MDTQFGLIHVAGHQSPSTDGTSKRVTTELSELAKIVGPTESGRSNVADGVPETVENLEAPEEIPETLSEALSEALSAVTETPETVEEPSGELTEEEQLEQWLTRDPNEEPEMNALRVQYTRAILAIPNITEGTLSSSAPRPIDIRTAVVLGFMVVKKARYNISYDPVTEAIIAHVNRILSESLRRGTVAGPPVEAAGADVGEEAETGGSEGTVAEI